MPFRSFSQVETYITRFTDYERMTGGRYAGQPYDLRRMARLLEAIGHPERGFPSVHIAGTKGKGSTAHFAEAIFRAHGLRTGLYTSPHLVRMLERIRLAGEPAAEPLFVRTMNRMRRAMDRLRPTYFEIMTAAAFLIFAERRVGMGVIEVGLGGRLDATNLIRPSACGIARIDYDHVDRLGSTLGAIASEKAGIIKPGVPVFTTETRSAAVSAIRRKARAVRAPLGEIARTATRVRTGARTEFTWRATGTRSPCRARSRRRTRRWRSRSRGGRWCSSTPRRRRADSRGRGCRGDSRSSGAGPSGSSTWRTTRSRPGRRRGRCAPSPRGARSACSERRATRTGAR